jgi:hypothetical protein
MTTTTDSSSSTETSTFRSWDQLTRREQLLSMISDDYKDLYGFRPRGSVDDMTDDDLQVCYDEIRADLDRKFERKARDKQEHERRTAEALSRKEWTLGELVGL